MNNRIKLAAELYVERNKNMVLKSKVSDNIFYHLIDKNAKFEVFVSVLDVLKRYEYENISIVTKKWEDILALF